MVGEAGNKHLDFVCLVVTDTLGKNKTREYTGKFAILNRMVREDFIGNVTFEYRLESHEGVSREAAWGKYVLGGGTKDAVGGT